MYRKSNVPSTPAELPSYLDQELSNIEQGMQATAPYLSLAKQYAAPQKVWEGMVVLADGVQWNPGSGAGFYGYRGGAWRLLG